MKRRTAKYDLMRIMMSLFVICIHTTLPSSISGNNLLYNSIRTFLFMCNGIFFMLSGKFNLKKNFEKKTDYYNYYVDKFITIIMPYGLISCILVVITDKSQSIKQLLYMCVNAFFSTNGQNHFWFMCCLIGMLVSAPFLAKMLNNMENFELKLLFSIGIIWSIVAIYLTTDMGIPFALTSFFLWGWLFYFWLGYFCDRVVDDSNIKIFYTLGIIGYIFTVWGLTNLNTFANPQDLSAGFMLFTVASYLFLEKHLEIKSEFANKIIIFWGKYSFLAYMIHYVILQKIGKVLFDSQSRWLNYILCVLVTFVLSYLVSVLISCVLIKPIQTILRKVKVVCNIFEE